MSGSSTPEAGAAGRSRRIGTVVVFIVLGALVGLALWRTSVRPSGELRAIVRAPQGVMGTSCRLAVTLSANRGREADAALAQAEATLRRAESLLSAFLSESEIGRFNAAPAGETIPLSSEVLTVMRVSERASRATAGAFDVTVRPLLELWRAASRRGHPPGESELATARSASSWESIRIGEEGATKLSGGACVDFGGIAKGFGIDWAIADLAAAGAAGGLVDIGGDLRVFGRPPEDELWTIGIRNPFADGELANLRITNAAICTSGNYARFVTVAGKRYSHILDPRTGRPADVAPAVTVVAATAAEADVWATALSVLGTPGFNLLPEDVEALLVTGTAEDPKIACTARLCELLVGAPESIDVVCRGSDPVSLREHEPTNHGATPDHRSRSAQEGIP